MTSCFQSKYCVCINVAEQKRVCNYRVVTSSLIYFTLIWTNLSLACNLKMMSMSTSLKLPINTTRVVLVLALKGVLLLIQMESDLDAL